jgi:excisionase family DNA binding protein
MAMKEGMVSPLAGEPAHHLGKLLLTVDEAAEAISIKRSFLYVLLMRNEILSVKVGRVRRVPVKSLQDYVGRLIAIAQIGEDYER